MYIKNPEYFITTVREGSISKAAEKLYLSQPYLSQCIARTEKELGVKLFDRSHMPLKLTEAGKIYMRYLESVGGLTGQFEEQLGELSDGILLWSDFTATGDLAFSSPGFVRRDPLYISEDIYPLESDTDYYAVAFGCNENGEFSNSRVSRKLFHTKAFTPTEACTFTIDVTVDQQDLAIKVIPSDKNTSYITFIDERDTYRDNFATPRQYPPYDLYWRMQGLEAGQTIGDDDCFYTGDAAYNVVSLKAASAYIVFAYGCSADGRITTEPEIVEVHTKGTVDQPDLNSAAKRRRTVSARPAYRVIR